jgi:TetR/AcrR family transcriptional regulator, tetracycline repressor protein
MGRKPNQANAVDAARKSKNGTSGEKSLNRELIVSAALQFIDKFGEEALTMRKLAEVLEVYPTTIYWHAGNRAQLLAAVCERVFAEIELPPVDDTPWDEWLRVLAQSVRRTMRAHRNLAPTVSSQIQVTVGSFPLIEAILDVLSSAGFPDSDLPFVYNTVCNSIFGFVWVELNAEPSGADPDWAETFQQRLLSVEPADYPVLARAMPHLAGKTLMLRWQSGDRQPLGDSYRYVVDVLIAGLKEKLATSA